MEKEERPQGADGTADFCDTKMYLLKYCFGRPALLLTGQQTRIYLQMMRALNQGPYDLRPF